jgi:signal transduction histidine kinase
MMIQKIQQEVSYLNEIGVDLQNQGKLRSASLHFNMAMEKMKPVGQMAKKNKNKNKVQLPESSISSAHRPTHSCQPLPLHDAAFVGAHWELVTSMTLIHNAAMVQLKSGASANAAQLLQIATALIKKEIAAEELHQLLSRNKFALTALTSIYAALGKSTPNTKQAIRAFAAASGLVSRYSKVASPKLVPTEVAVNDVKMIESSRSSDEPLANAFMLLKLRGPCYKSTSEAIPYIVQNSRAC